MTAALAELLRPSRRRHPARADGWDPILPEAICGNQRVLVCLDASGQIVQIAFPHPDAGVHRGRLSLGLAPDPLPSPPLWLDDEGWEHRLWYQEGTNVVESESCHPGQGWLVARTTYVPPDHDVIVQHLRLVNQGPEPRGLRHLFYEALALDGAGQPNSIVYLARAGGFVHFGRETHLVVGASRALDEVWCGLQPGPGRTAAPTSGTEGYLAAAGDVAAAFAQEDGILQPGQAAEVTLYLALGSAWEEARSGFEQARGAGHWSLLDRTRGHWHWLNGQVTPPPGLGPPEERLYRRSLLALRLLTDRGGALLAAPECDPRLRGSGGYGYCWPRDGAYVAHALLRSGQDAWAADFMRWSLQVQDKSGAWLQRYWADGRLGPTWGLLQIDETGTLLWALSQHLEKARERDPSLENWVAVRAAANFLLGAIDQESGLLKSSVDLWEQHRGVFTYSVAATCAGLRGAARVAEAFGYTRSAERWFAAAEHLLQRGLEALWDPEQRRFRRGLVAPPAPEPSTNGSGPARGDGSVALVPDPTVDISILGLTVPFELLPASDPRMAASVRAIERRLGRGGGLLRHQHDTYRGGNPWILANLWLAWFDLRAGKSDRARERFRWCVQRQSGLGLLPEQVNARTGRPVWVMPLAWSHALYLIVAHELAQNATAP